MRSEEGKSAKDRKEDEEVEWYPAPPNTSATFLNQTGGLGFGERDEEEAEEEKGKRMNQLYLSGALDDEESDSSRRGGKRRDMEKDGTRKGENSSEKAERRSTSTDRRERSKERGKEDRRDSKRRVSCSSAESEYSRKPNVKSEFVSKQLESRTIHGASKRNSFEYGRYENRGRVEIREIKEAEKDDRKRSGQEESGRSERRDGLRSVGDGNHEQGGLTSLPAGRPKKDLPSNLLDIFNQIAQFEREKGVRPKQ